MKLSPSDRPRASTESASTKSQGAKPQYSKGQSRNSASSAVATADTPNVQDARSQIEWFGTFFGSIQSIQSSQSIQSIHLLRAPREILK